MHNFADEIPYHNNDKYNEAGFGQYVTQTFPSNPDVTSVPIINFMKPFTGCDDGSYLFIAPRGNSAESTPMILDVTGSPVWASTTRYGQVYNLQVQQYRDQYYLTFWGGNDAVNGHGEGEYFMLDQQYNERFRIKAANGLGGDLHAFTITPDNTALITIYQPIVTDISSKLPGRDAGWIWDSLFQELDIETGEAIFQWRASTHIPLTSSYGPLSDATEAAPWDCYHINSVEKDADGNYLVSFRYLYAIIYIDGKTGNIIWQLGGMNNSFTDLSGGAATSFMGQHDAHWQDGHRYITFFDNRADWDHAMEDHSQGTRIEINLQDMTARLDATFTDPFTKISSSSQGSYQTLPNGNVVLGYGFNGVVSEFSHDGELLCDAFFEPSSRFNTGDVQSYRNLRFNWTAYPDTSPNLATSASQLHISWNGATEVDTWLILGSNTHPQDNEHEDTISTRSKPDPRSIPNALIVPKDGFETVVDIPADIRLGPFIRAIALDEDGTALGTSNVVDIGDPSGPTPPTEDLQSVEDLQSAEDHQSAENTQSTENHQSAVDLSGAADQQILLGLGIMAMVSTILLTRVIFRRETIALPRRWGPTRLLHDDDDDNDDATPSRRIRHPLLPFFPRDRHADDPEGDACAAGEELVTCSETARRVLVVADGASLPNRGRS